MFELVLYKFNILISTFLFFKEKREVREDSLLLSLSFYIILYKKIYRQNF